MVLVPEVVAEFADRGDHLGDQDHRRDLAAVAAGLAAGGDDDVNPSGDLTHGVFAGSHQGGDRDAVLTAELEHARRRHAEGVGDEADGVPEGDHHGVLRSGRMQVASEVQRTAPHRLQAVAIDIVSRQHLGGEGLVRLGDGGEQALGIERRALAEHLVRDQQVDAVRLAVDVGVNPGEFLLEPFGSHARCAEHAHAAGARDLGDDVATVAESEQRELDAQAGTQRRCHRRALTGPCRQVRAFP